MCMGRLACACGKADERLSACSLGARSILIEPQRLWGSCPYCDVDELSQPAK
jgi:hypothetical protein